MFPADASSTTTRTTGSTPTPLFPTGTFVVPTPLPRNHRHTISSTHPRQRKPLTCTPPHRVESDETAAGIAGAVVLLPLMMIAVLLAVVFIDDEDACTPTRPMAAVVQGDPGSAPAERGAPAPSGERTYPLAAGTYTVTDGFGTRGAHRGVDYAAADGTPMHAAAPGNVVASGPASGFGQDHCRLRRRRGSPFSTVYGHIFPDLRVKVGDVVKAGDHIAAVGYNGEVQPPGPGGAHLHFEVWPGGRLTGGSPIDPETWLGGAATPKTRPGDGTSTPAPAPVCEDGFGTQGGQLADGVVPPELEPWYRKAGSLCPQITPSLLAAQGKQESGFQRGLSSPDNCAGLCPVHPVHRHRHRPGRPPLHHRRRRQRSRLGVGRR